MDNQPKTNPYDAHPVNACVAYQQDKKNGLAIASLILGILSLMFYIFTAIPGIITGHMARSRVNKNPDEYSGKGMALAGLIFSYIMLALSLVLIAGIVFAFISNPELTDYFMEDFNRGLQKSAQ
jgi:hypothetical protein